MTLTAKTLNQRLNTLAEKARRSRRGWWSDTEWTRRVKQLLVELADNYQTCASISDATWGEWMCDVIWWDSDKDELLCSIPLAAECEWGKEQDVWDDFQKLLITRAAVRVMIFSANSRDKALSLVEELKKQIACFDSSQERDTYLFASYVHTENPPFSVEKYVWRKNS